MNAAWSRAHLLGASSRRWRPAPCRSRARPRRRRRSRRTSSRCPSSAMSRAMPARVHRRAQEAPVLVVGLAAEDAGAQPERRRPAEVVQHDAADEAPHRAAARRRAGSPSRRRRSMRGARWTRSTTMLPMPTTSSGSRSREAAPVGVPAAQRHPRRADALARELAHALEGGVEARRRLGARAPACRARPRRCGSRPAAQRALEARDRALAARRARGRRGTPRAPRAPRPCARASPARHTCQARAHSRGSALAGPATTPIGSPPRSR